jgi:multiple antibiotic resistance protein
MSEMAAAVLPFLAILNPFALCLYLVGVMDDLEPREFFRVLALASTVSLVVFCVFAIGGEFLLEGLLGLEPASLRVFGGAIFFVVGYNYVTKGFRATELLRGSLEELPSAIALPFMIGAGTITQAMLIGRTNSISVAIVALASGVALSFAVVAGFMLVRHRLKGKHQRVFNRYTNILSRINGLMIGAISTQMVVQGAHALWRNAATA